MAMMLAMEMGQATGQRLARGQEMMLAMVMCQATGQRLARGQEMMLAMMVMFQARGQARGQETSASYRARLLRPCCV